MEVECENISSDGDENSREATEPRRSPKIRKAPDQYGEWVYIAHRLDDPLIVKEALSSPEKREWMKAMESEINSLNTNKGTRLSRQENIATRKVSSFAS